MNADKLKEWAETNLDAYIEVLKAQTFATNSAVEPATVNARSRKTGVR